MLGPGSSDARHQPDAATAIQYIHSSSRVRYCQQTASAHHCSVRRIGVGIKLTVRFTNSAHVRDGCMCTFIIVVCIMRIFTAFTVLFCNLFSASVVFARCLSAVPLLPIHLPQPVLFRTTHILLKKCMSVSVACARLLPLLYCVINANSVVTRVLGITHRRITIGSAVGVSSWQPVTCCGHSPLVSQYKPAAQWGLIKGTRYQYLSIYAWVA